MEYEVKVHGSAGKPGTAIQPFDDMADAIDYAASAWLAGSEAFIEVWGPATHDRFGRAIIAQYGHAPA